MHLDWLHVLGLPNIWTVDQRVFLSAKLPHQQFLDVVAEFLRAQILWRDERVFQLHVDGIYHSAQRCVLLHLFQCFPGNHDE